MLTYKGLGYTPAFVARMDEAMAGISAGAKITLVDGPDDLCAALTDGCGHEGHCREARTFERDALAIAALDGVLPLAMGEPFALSAESLARLQLGFASRALRRACSGCEWVPVCDDIAAKDFVESRLNLRLKPNSVAP
jgi:uncharacterized protein